MTEPVSTLKTVVGTFTAVAIGLATADALRQAERVILGVPQSVLLVAIAGALIGVLLLPEEDAERVSADAARPRGRRNNFYLFTVRPCPGRATATQTQMSNWTAGATDKDFASVTQILETRATQLENGQTRLEARAGVLLDVNGRVIGSSTAG